MNKSIITFLRILLTLCSILPLLSAEEESLPPLDGKPAPQTFEEMWGAYDPRKEPLDVEILKEWEEDGVILKAVRYRIGIFKGKKAMMAAIYGYPKGGSKLPGLVNIHGGGQFADYKAPLINGKRGYATITIAWAGRISAPQYMVQWGLATALKSEKTDLSNYKVTTDWGVLDAYHAPSRNPENSFGNIHPFEWTLDPVVSPRNNPWFLCALGARRALTFLEQQPEVDPEKLGVYGHSMGGKITVFTAASDSRVKACAPSCGGISDRYSKSPLYDATIGDQALLPRIKCPILFLSPSNDFHGRINNLQTALTEIQSKEFRMTCAPHHNHQDTPEYECATSLWFDHHLRGKFQVPKTPDAQLNLKTRNGIPIFKVTPDPSREILSVDIHYTQDGPPEGVSKVEGHNGSIERFWRHVTPTASGNSWGADLPLFSIDKPLWVYANVLYSLDQPVTGAGYYYGHFSSKEFNLSSEMKIASTEELKASEVKAVDKLIPLIEDFGPRWEKEWFTYNKGHWSRTTYKLSDPQWKAPPGAQLALEVQSERENKLVILLGGRAAEISLTGGKAPQSFLLSPGDFKNALEEPLPDWSKLITLRITDQEKLTGKKDGKEIFLSLGSPWKGAPPTFKNLQWTNQP